MQTTKNSAPTAFGRIVLTAALAALPILTACGHNAAQQAPEAQTVEVHLKDGVIQMPASVPSGPTTFEVVNDGSQALSFEIDGPALLEEAPTVQPGQTASVDMVLDPGTYRVHVPENRSMVVALNVNPS
jgi:hypothetical protein